MYYTLEKESAGWQNIQSLIPNPNGPNGREDSWGICQIHIHDKYGRVVHPGITREMAMDWRWCIPWAAQQFVDGNANQWTEYQLLYSESGSHNTN